MNPSILRALIVGSQKRGLLGKCFPKHSRWYFRERSAVLLDDFFFRALAVAGVDCLLECGAHEASASIRFSKRGKRAIAIEANPLTCELKTLDAEKHGVEVLNFGLGAERGELKFYVPEKVPMAGNATFQPKSYETYMVESVPVNTIDNLIDDRQLTSVPVALWVDVEGFSREVLQGASTLLASEHCLIIKIEVETYPYFAGQALCTEVTDILESHGFICAFVDDQFEQQFNVVFVKKDIVDTLSLEISLASESVSHISFGAGVLIKVLIKKLKVRAFLCIRWILLKILGQTKAYTLLAKAGSLSSRVALKKLQESRD